MSDVADAGQCKYCTSRGEHTVEVRKGSGTYVYMTCNVHRPQRGANSQGFSPMSQVRALGAWGASLRRLAGI
jgi:hypothetical protein